jgi:hypothetical protein
MTVRVTGKINVAHTVLTMHKLASKPKNMANAAAEPIGGPAACNTSNKRHEGSKSKGWVKPQTHQGEIKVTQRVNSTGQNGRCNHAIMRDQSMRSKAAVKVPITVAVNKGRAACAKPGNKIPTNTPAGKAQRACRPSQRNAEFTFSRSWLWR